MLKTPQDHGPDLECAAIELRSLSSYVLQKVLEPSHAGVVSKVREIRQVWDVAEVPPVLELRMPTTSAPIMTVVLLAWLNVVRRSQRL